MQQTERSSSRARTNEAPCWLDVDLAAVRHNVQVVQSSAQPRLGVTAVVKANAYGLGMVPIAKAALDAGAIQLAVARVSEAQTLRLAGIRAPILLMGPAAPDEADTVVRLRVTPTVTDGETLDRYSEVARRIGQRVPLQIKVDTGLTRYGAPPEEAQHLVRVATSRPYLELTGFYTHFAAADDPDPFFAFQQLARYRSIRSQLEAEGFQLGQAHAASSAGALRIPGAGLDTVRIGIALSGSHATGWVPRTDDLRLAIAFRARIARIQIPGVGTSVGYGRTYKVYRPMRVALISCGYADGLPRACGNRGHVLIRGQRAPLIGTVSMDMAMADVSHISGSDTGDEVTILGDQGSDRIGIDEFAESAGLIPHELLVRLGSRLERVYRRGDGMQEHAEI